MESRYTKIVLRDVEVSARVGLASWERETSQRLVANVEFYAEAEDYLGRVKPATIIDYCRLYDLIRSWTVRPHTELLEKLVTRSRGCLLRVSGRRCVPRFRDEAAGTGLGTGRGHRSLLDPRRLRMQHRRPTPSGADGPAIRSAVMLRASGCANHLAARSAPVNPGAAAFGFRPMWTHRA